jgi:hypothetical protein
MAGLRRARLALDEAARDLARGVHPLLVVDGEREEVGALAGLLGGDGRGQDDAVAVAHDDGAIGLLGELAGLHAEDLAADLGLMLDGQVKSSKGSWCGCPALDLRGALAECERRRQAEAETRGDSMFLMCETQVSRGPGSIAFGASGAVPGR